jgi:hypothetical protein
MQQIFLVLAVADATLLLITFALGLFVPSGQGGLVHDLHFLVALLTMVATLMVHGVVYTYFIGTNKWVKEVVRVYQLPASSEHQSKQNKRRAFPFILWGMLLIGVTAWLGAAADTIRGFGGLWHMIAAVITLAFTFAAFAFEYRAISSQARLIDEVRARAEAARAAPADAHPDPQTESATA